MTQTKSKRDLILDAAYNLFINKGYWDTKIIDISEAAESEKERFMNILKVRMLSFLNYSEPRWNPVMITLQMCLVKKFPVIKN